MTIDWQWLGFGGMALAIVAYLPQVLHLIRERCSAGISTGAYSLWALAAVLLLTYSISRRDAVFIALQTYQVGATLLILMYGRKYRHSFCESHGGHRPPTEG